MTRLVTGRVARTAEDLRSLYVDSQPEHKQLVNWNLHVGSPFGNCARFCREYARFGCCIRDERAETQFGEQRAIPVSEMKALARKILKAGATLETVA